MDAYILFFLHNWFCQIFKKVSTKEPPLDEEEEPPKKGSGQYQSILLSQYACTAHSCLCYPMSDTNHKAISHTDIGVWSTLIVCVLIFMCAMPYLTSHRLLGMQLSRIHLVPYGLNNGHLSGHWQNSQILLPLLLLLLYWQTNYCSWNFSKITHQNIHTLTLVLTLIHSPLGNDQSLHPPPSFTITLQYTQSLTIGSRVLITALKM